MYEGNYLAEKVSSASINRLDAVFIEHGVSAEILSYRDFWSGVEKTAAALVANGVAPGDRVAVQAPKTIAMLQLYVGTVLAGGVFLPLNTGYTPAEISYFLEDAEPRVFVCDPAKLEALSPLVGQ